MGEGIGFRCEKCGQSFTAYVGIGFSFPGAYQKVATTIQKGKFGKEWKDLFENTPGAAVNADRELYVCSACGWFREDVNLSLYAPKDSSDLFAREDMPSGLMPSEGKEYVLPWELKNSYRLVKAFSHKCQCGERMHQYRKGDRLKCPECKDGWMAEDPSGWIDWD